MIKKSALLSLLCVLSMASCTGAVVSDELSGVAESSDADVATSIPTVPAVEEADPWGFDPNFDYVGTSADDFKIIASMYAGNTEFVPEPETRENDWYVKTVLDFGIITFPFRGTSVVAYHRGPTIIEVHRFQSGKMTIGEARSLGYVGEAKAKQSEGYVHFRSRGKPSSTKRYERKLDENLGTYDHTDNQGRFTGIGKYVDLFTKYGIPTSMLVYYDGMANDYINDMAGNGYMGLSVDYASAIPIYSDDLTEIVGAMTIGYCSGSLSKAFTYLKEDGFGEVKKAKDMISQLNDTSIDVVSNPRFYLENTSLLPKGDWKIILGYQY